MTDFLKIGITLPEAVPDEAAKICRALRCRALDRVHIRHEDEAMTESILSALPTDLMPRVSIHGHHDLARKFGACIHCRSNDYGDCYSASCHSLEEVEKRRGCRYVFLSPIFPSISKPGYSADFNLDTLTLPAEVPVVALGGVTPEHFGQLRQARFAGAAMLGAVNWGDESLFTKFLELCCNS